MYHKISDYLRDAVEHTPEGDVVKKYAPMPKNKPPRRKSPLKNKSNQEDYMRKYMEGYRGDGKDYQKVPDEVKKWRREKNKKDEK